MTREEIEREARRLYLDAYSHARPWPPANERVADIWRDAAGAELLKKESA